MKKHFLTLFIFFLALPVVWATNLYYNITQENSVSQIQTELQEIINSAGSGDTIVVTGSKTNADITLALSIAIGEVVVWQANYQSNGAFGDNSLIAFSGSGTFIVENNAQLSITTGEIITSTGNDATIYVNSGTLTATTGNTIVALGRDPQIYVSGGYLSNDATDLYPTIVAYDLTGNTALIDISGTAKVEAKGKGCAITSSGVVIISENAQVINSLGGDSRTATVRGYIIDIRDNAKVTASNNCAIMGYIYVVVKDHAIVEAKDNAIAIYMYGEGNSMGSVDIFGNAQVIASHNYAISYNVTNFALAVKGGLVFAYGTHISDVVDFSGFEGPTDTGVVLAWDKEAGNTTYSKYSTQDIFKFPEDVIAYWDEKEGKFGISYENDDLGFIPIDDAIVLSIRESSPLNTIVSPNPVTDKLTITNRELPITDVEIFDVYGRKVLSSKFQLSTERTLDISHFNAGSYFVRVTTENGMVTKKVIKY